MTDDLPRDAVPAATRVPTLTEVIDAADPSSWRASHDRVEAPAPVIGNISAASSLSAAAAVTLAGESDRLHDTLADALAHVDADVDARLRHALQPILADAVDRLVAAARRELASSLRELMAGSTAIDHVATPARRDADSSPF